MERESYNNGEQKKPSSTLSGLSKADKLAFAVDVVARLNSGELVPIARKMIGNTISKLAGSRIRTAGTLVLQRIEAATGQTLTCGSCRQYLLTLTGTLQDADTIITRLAVDLPLPPHIRELYNTQQKRREWLQPIVTTALLDWCAE